MTTLAPYDFDEPVIWAGFIDDEPCYALADGKVHFPVISSEAIEAHDGLLCATPALDRKSLLTGGEGGRVVRITRQCSQTLAEEPGKWIDTIAAGPDGAFAFAAGRTVWVSHDGALKRIEHERAVQGLNFAPNGLRVAAARYNGVSLHGLADDDQPISLNWKGAHTGVCFSPNGKFVVTTMAENTLHGWRLENPNSGDDAHMHMAGYPTKPKSMSWSREGNWLATSGAQSAVCWPFSDQTGPMGKTPKELAMRAGAVALQVACHPIDDYVAIGYSDGVIVAAQINDVTGAVLRHSSHDEISTLNWDSEGHRLAFGTASGEAGVVTV